MFEILTNDPERLRRIVAAGGGAIVVGVVLAAYNLLLPFVTAGGHTTVNFVFGGFGLLVVLLATHPTNEAVQRLEDT